MSHPAAAPNSLERLLGETQARLLSLVRRSPQPINRLAASLDLTDNAVRTHVAALGRDGLIEQSGSERDTGGKPARLYGLTREGEELFPKAYATVLEKLIEEITIVDGADRASELLRGVGVRIGATLEATGGTDSRVTAGANLLRSLGGEIDIVTTKHGWELQGHGCPLSAVSANRHEVCELARAMIGEVSGLTVHEVCQRGERPKCGFSIER